MFALHAKSHTTKAETVCTTWKPTISCDDYNTGGLSAASADVYLVIVAPDPVAGVAGASCWIEYSAAERVGVDVFGWTLCADQEFTSAGVNGEWPAAFGGNRIVWFADTNCQRTVIDDYVHAIAGAFYLYAYGEDVFRIMPDRNPETPVADCRGLQRLHLLSPAVVRTGCDLGFADALYHGCNPCTASGFDCFRDPPPPPQSRSSGAHGGRSRARIDPSRSVLNGQRAGLYRAARGAWGSGILIGPLDDHPGEHPGDHPPFVITSPELNSCNCARFVWPR